MVVASGVDSGCVVGVARAAKLVPVGTAAKVPTAAVERYAGGPDGFALATAIPSTTEKTSAAVPMLAHWIPSRQRHGPRAVRNARHARPSAPPRIGVSTN